jgi:hypothetical protein
LLRTAQRNLGFENVPFAAAWGQTCKMCGHQRPLRSRGVRRFNYRSVSDSVQRISATGWMTAQAMRAPLLPLGSVM